MKLSGCSVVILSLLLFSAPLYAADWSLGLGLHTDTQLPSGSGAFGARDPWSDGFDPLVDRCYLCFGLKPMVALGAYYEHSANWLGPTDFYFNDYRGAMLPGDTQEWLFYFWLSPDVPGGLDIMYPRWSRGFGSPLPDGLHLTATLVQRPGDPSIGDPLGTTWDLRQTPVGRVTVPAVYTADGRQGAALLFTATMVPEPSSLFALTGGMGLLAGLIRRGKG